MAASEVSTGIALLQAERRDSSRRSDTSESVASRRFLARHLPAGKRPDDSLLEAAFPRAARVERRACVPPGARFRQPDYVR